MFCVKSVSYSFVRDGNVFGEVKPQRGIRQGDSISPYFYILCAEGLSAIFGRFEETGLLHGCRIARGAPSVSYLLFADDCYFFFKATKGEADMMKDILNRYEKILGQAINYRKSNIVFSPNTSSKDKTMVCNSLGVEEAEKPGKYLGMPMCVGKNKRDVFGFLAEKVGHKLQGWANKDLSTDGKLPLLKSAAQTIPNFWRSLFLIPHSIYDEIENLMNSFWWGKESSGTGIRWFSWEKLSVSNMGGGLGVKNLKNFNISILAKQGWKLLNNSNPLVSAIMKAKYYPKTDFLNAEIGESPSYIWRSILDAKDAIKAGCRRRIGDGASTYVWEVPWLPDGDNGFVSTTMPVHLKEARVQNLIDMEGRDWDAEVLHDIFNERDVDLINRIPIPAVQRDDSWFWLRDDKGQFTVRSCYRWLQGEHDAIYSNFWKKLWSLKMPGEVTNFL